MSSNAVPRNMKLFIDNNWYSLNKHLPSLNWLSIFLQLFFLWVAATQHEGFSSFKGWASLAKGNLFSLVNGCLWSSCEQWESRKCLLKANKAAGNQYLFLIRRKMTHITSVSEIMGVIFGWNQHCFWGKEICKEPCWINHPESLRYLWYIS